jgi:hypothetical protein
MQKKQGLNAIDDLIVADSEKSCCANCPRRY